MRLYDGGHAFPRAGFYPDTGNVHQEDIRECIATKTEPQDGMTLRDWFAGHALAGMLAHSTSDDAGPYSTQTYGEAACEAYKYADAMLKSRDPKPPANPADDAE